ncbi:MAG: uncharacterized membrane protein YheB (UPF0754 family) [bacterium]|jgi:uncharacterized membrane protein YheB (UPF0754 family)
MSLNQVDKIFRRILLLASILFGVSKVFYENQWLNAGFLITMTGVVGYYTNFLAIKMLFKPKKGKVLGWEGLVPKNQPKIAKNLSNSIQTQLLAPEILIEYISENNLIENTTLNIANWLDKTLKKETIRRKITIQITNILKERGPIILSTFFDISEESLKNMASNPKEIEIVWKALREKIVEFIRAEENRQFLADKIREFFLEDLPTLSHNIDQAVDHYLDSKKMMGSIGKKVKKLTDIDEEKIQELLANFINDPKTSNQIMDGLDKMVGDLQEKLNSTETQEWILEKLESWITSSGYFTRENLLPKIIVRLEEFLDVNQNWEILDDYFLRFVVWIKENLVEFLNTPQGIEWLKLTISSLIQRIKIVQIVEQQILALDTDELEQLILDNTGGNLVVIQTLGGVLGLVAGLIQVNLLFAIPIFAVSGIAWIQFILNKKKFQKEENS